MLTPLQLALFGMGPELVIQREGLLISKVLCLFLNHKLVEVEETISQSKPLKLEREN